MRLTAMDNTLFGKLFRAIYDGRINTAKKYNELIFKVLETYDIEESGFKIGNQLLSITAKDISLLFGIPMKADQIMEKKVSKGEKIKSTPGWDFVIRNFGKKARISPSMISEAIKTKSRGKQESIMKDYVTLMCCSICCHLLFPYGSGTIRKGTMVSLYEEMETASWPHIILKELLCSAESYCTAQSAPGGCTIALLYWLVEHVNITTMKEGQEE